MATAFDLQYLKNQTWSMFVNGEINHSCKSFITGILLPSCSSGISKKIKSTFSTSIHLKTGSSEPSSQSNSDLLLAKIFLAFFFEAALSYNEFP